MLTAAELSEAAEAVAAGSTWARSVLDGAHDEAPEHLDEGVPEALVEILVERGDGDALGWVAGLRRPTALAKAARKAAHRLRTKGVEVTVTPSEGARGPGGDAEVDAPPSLISQYDGRGQRIVWLAQTETRGLLLHRARLSWRGGLLELKTGMTSRSEFRRVLRDLEQRELLTARCDEAAASWLLSASARLTKARGRGLPEGYLLASRLLKGNRDAPHPGLDQAPGDGDVLALYERPEALLGWMPDEETAQGIGARLQEIAMSPILLDAAQRKAQALEALHQAAKDYFLHQDQRDGSRAFLLDMVQLYALRGDAVTAGTLRAAAALFETEDVREHPFAQRFFERFFDLDKVAAGPEAAHHDHHHDHDGPCDHPDHHHGEPEAETGDKGGLVLP